MLAIPKPKERDNEIAMLVSMLNTKRGSVDSSRSLSVEERIADAKIVARAERPWADETMIKITSRAEVICEDFSCF